MSISFVDLFSDIGKAGKPNFETQRIRKQMLIEHDSPYLRQFLRYTFHPEVMFVLPKGSPPYQKLAEGAQNSKLIYGQIRMIKYFTNEYDGNISSLKKEQMFIQVLESVTPEEADLLIQMKNKKLNVPGLTYKLVQDTFPDMLP
jgi:hypothetical protein